MSEHNFLEIHCKECNNNQTVFKKASTTVHCLVCEETLVTPRGSTAALTQHAELVLDEVEPEELERVEVEEETEEHLEEKEVEQPEEPEDDSEEEPEEEAAEEDEDKEE